MNQQLTFRQAKARYLKKLALYVPVVDKVHGSNHPEFHEIRALAEVIIAKSNTAGVEKPMLEEEFIRLRALTGNYHVPGDVCESYEAVYQMLEQLDRAYTA